MEQFSRIFIYLGLTLVIVGLLFGLGARLGLGKLPGDIFFKRGNVSFYFPVVTSILLSIFLTFILNIFFRRR